MKIKKFEDIESWKKARKLTNEIYRTTATGKFYRDFGLKDQIRRAAVSILSNIAEGFERGGDKEFSQFLGVAKGSCGEVRAQLYVALDQVTFRRKSLKRYPLRQLRSVNYFPGSSSILKAHRSAGTDTGKSYAFDIGHWTLDFGYWTFLKINEYKHP